MKVLKYILLGFIITLNLKAELADKASLILGSPTNNSVTLNLLAKSKLIFYVEYGLSSGKYSFKTLNDSSIFPEPCIFTLSNLQPGCRYYYRIQFKNNFTTDFIPSDEFYFNTQKSRGEKFSFSIITDTHLYDKKGSPGEMTASMLNQATDSLDFIFDLGDTFGDDHNPTTITSEQVKQLHLNLLPYFSIACKSSPLFLCLGNHEGESGYYLLQTPPNNLAVYETIWRTKYYSNPVPNTFYSGNTESEGYGMGQPQNYYSFEWGDGLFVVLDVYRYASANDKPQKWDFTIGDKQYFWLKNILENSKAKYKFVFAHHTLGQGRGAAKTAMLYEWGGYEDTGKTKYTFDSNRPGWGKPIHDLMKDNAVQIFFQGHDHLFAKEFYDGIVYQECPMGADSTYEIGYLANADAYTDLKLDGSGYVRVTLSDAEAKVDYVKSYLKKDETDSLKNGMIGFTYTVKPNATSAEEITPNRKTFEVYPNPANDFIMVNGGSENIKIMDIFGEVLWNGDASKNHLIDISFLQTGIYVIKSQYNIVKLIKR